MAKTPFPNDPRAYMGFVGYVKILGYTVRATSADVNLTQEITKPDVVDSRYDRSVYQLGPQLVDGSISFPVVYEAGIGGTTLFEVLYNLAVNRDAIGELGRFDVEVKYASNVGFKYTKCVINTWKFSVAQSDVVTCDFDIIGEARETGTLSNPSEGDVSTTRIVTWNDAFVNMSLAGGTVESQNIRTFDCSIANDVERFYSLNGVLAPQALAARKRDVTGSLTVMGRHDVLAGAALANEINCTESSTIDFGYITNSTGEGCTGSTFSVTLPNCVFEIETLSLTNDIFESTVAYHSLPGAGTGITDPLRQV